MISAVIFAMLATGSAPADAASLVARVNLSQQRMEVYLNGHRQHVWPVSTGRDGWHTPPGNYQPFALKQQYYSTKWKMNLPYLIWISGDGIAIHGTELSGKLGRRASHGCIRLSIPNAAKFYSLVEKHGMGNTAVVVAR